MLAAPRFAPGSIIFQSRSSRESSALCAPRTFSSSASHHRLVMRCAGEAWAAPLPRHQAGRAVSRGRRDQRAQSMGSSPELFSLAARHMLGARLARRVTFSGLIWPTGRLAGWLASLPQWPVDDAAALAVVCSGVSLSVARVATLGLRREVSRALAG